MAEDGVVEDVDGAVEAVLLLSPVASASLHRGVAITILATRALHVEAWAETIDVKETDHSDTLVTHDW